ncbi:MAG TPA: hypothetical protein VNT81_09975 [Vicinamibacterales bacterium]|nr:hypothetical protein [Vicinamibacterales bacterium]
MAVIMAFFGAVAIAATSLPQKPAAKPADAPVKERLKSKTVSKEERLDALSRAAVWHAPPPISKARFEPDPKQPREVSCTFEITQLGGTAPKFDCRTAEGERIRVKYGRSPEVPSEVAAAKLLHALGFGADTVMLVERVRCYGCPTEPFMTMKTLGFAGAEKLYGKVMDTKEFKDFEWASVERRHEGRPIETDDVEGWAFFELDVIDAKKGGAPKAHVDALRLLAVFLSHWDNKSENQRLMCLSEKDWPEGGKCSKPFAMMQDVGAAWGPRKVDLPEWEKAPIWADRASCKVSMDSLPYHGATFTPVTVTDAGRRHLGGLLSQLTDQQIDALFRHSRFDQTTGLLGGVKSSSIEDWVRAFRGKVRQITDGAPCPQ